MKKFYLNHNFENPLKVEISPNLAETLDESLDNMTITLGIEENDKPYAPTLNVIGVYEEDEQQNRTLINEFVISSDNIELVTQNPLRYKHTVSLVQKSQFTTKHLIRNNVFSTSLEGNELFKTFGGNFFLYIGQQRRIRLQNNNLEIDLSKYSIKNLSLKTNFYALFQNSYISFVQTDSQQPLSQRMVYSYGVSNNIVKKWSDTFVNNSIGVTNYPIIYFQIDNEPQKELNLGNIYDGEIIKIPQSIIEWIQQHNTGILTIGIKELYLDSLNGFIVSPNNSVNCPVFGKLTFDTYLKTVEISTYEIIESLLKQYERETALYNESNDSSIKPLFKMPDDSNAKRTELKQLLLNTQAPNFVFTQASMFDALSEIFRLFDATFRIDEDNYLEIEYFNDRKIEDKIELSDSMKAGKTSSLGEERFANRLVAFFQNTKINHKFPNDSSENATAYVRSRTFGVPKESDYVFEVPKPIDVINKVEMFFDFEVDYFSYILDFEPQGNVDLYEERIHLNNIDYGNIIDITDFVVEKDLWSSLPAFGTKNPFTYVRSQENTLTYTRGTKYIDVATYYNIQNDTLYQNTRKLILENILELATKRMLGVSSLSSFVINYPTIDIKDIKLSVDYIALVDGKLVNESIDNKYDGEILTNQSNGSIDIFKLGLNMVGLSLKLGQPTLTMTQKFTNWNNRIKKGQWFVKDGEVWVANTCSYTLITNDMVQATIEFVKNFNSLASRIELNREKRLTNISNELTVKCEETYGEFIYYIDNLNVVSQYEGEEITMHDNFLKDTLKIAFGVDLPFEKIEYASLTALDSSNNVIKLESGEQLDKISIPLVIYGSGNSICFEMSFDSPISAGTQLLPNFVSVVGTGWFSRAVLYSREGGTAEKFTIEFIKLEEEITRLFPKFKKQITSGSDYTESNLTPLNYSFFGKIQEFGYYKKSNEIFALNYQLHFLPIKRPTRNDCFLGSEFIKHNPFNEDVTKISKKFIYTLKDENDFEYSILDTKGQADHECNFDFSFTDVGDHKVAISFKLDLDSSVAAKIKTWAIVDGYNNIYFASNNRPRPSFSQGVTNYYADIVFIWRHHRLI